MITATKTELHKATELAPQWARSRIRVAFEKAVALCESPLEIALLPWLVAQPYHPFLYPPKAVNPTEALRLPAQCVGVVAQFPVGIYRSDFALTSRLTDDSLPRFVLVECDGAAFHDEVKDAKRDATIRRDASVLEIVRLTGSQIFQSPETSARIVAQRFILSFGKLL